MNETASPHKIVSKIFIKGKIIAKTGLHIGGNSVGMSIGSTDNVVVRNPFNNQPYIPGSSLRGKMRALMERVRGVEAKSGECEGGFHWNPNKQEASPGQNPKSKTAQLFGIAAATDEQRYDQTPTRLIVRDAPLTSDSRKALENAPNMDMPLTEVKTEVVIDRITAAAMPRQMERVPAGAEFDMELILTLIDGDESKKFLDMVCEGLHLIEADTLGGSGSRGYGQVKFMIDAVLEKTTAHYLAQQPAIPLDHHILQDFTVDKQANE
jgi:CRISPR-associated protein Csm3